MSAQKELIFGNIPDIPIGTTWSKRAECCYSGMHRSILAGIVGRQEEGVVSIAMSSAYIDDDDKGDTIIYTGCGGYDELTKTGKRARGGPQIKDQEYVRRNAALRTSCITKKPIRVVRGANRRSPYAPKYGYRYDGLYIAERTWQEKGKMGFLVCRYMLRRIPGQPPIPIKSRYMGTNIRGTSMTDDNTTERESSSESSDDENHDPSPSLDTSNYGSANVRQTTSPPSSIGTNTAMTSVLSRFDSLRKISSASLTVSSSSNPESLAHLKRTLPWGAAGDDLGSTPDDDSDAEFDKLLHELNVKKRRYNSPPILPPPEPVIKTEVEDAKVLAQEEGPVPLHETSELPTSILEGTGGMVESDHLVAVISEQDSERDDLTADVAITVWDGNVAEDATIFDLHDDRSLL